MSSDLQLLHDLMKRIPEKALPLMKECIYSYVVSVGVKVNQQFKDTCWVSHCILFEEKMKRISGILEGSEFDLAINNVHY